MISDQDKFQGRLPSLSFVAEENSSGADISILTLGPDQVPSTRSAMRVRKIGTMKFTPVASKAYLERTGMPKSFDDIVNFEILDHSRYKSDKGLSPWNELIAARSNGPNLVVDTTSGFYIPLISGCGIALLPPYAPLYEESLTILDVAAPLMAIELWLAAHEDSLREPAVRTVYDAVAQMFLSSRWFR
ncbi:MAG: LysR substrate-binding domain-containing protein [Azospirillaceae bacterium]